MSDFNVPGSRPNKNTMKFRKSTAALASPRGATSPRLALGSEGRKRTRAGIEAMYVCVCIYIYIYIERERERDRCIYISLSLYIYIYIYTYIQLSSSQLSSSLEECFFLRRRYHPDVHPIRIIRISCTILAAKGWVARAHFFGQIMLYDFPTVGPARTYIL